MRVIEWNKVPDYPGMVLLTSEEVNSSSKIMMADFRDDKALFHEKSGRYVGLSSDGRMRLGGKPLHMIDGLWYLYVDPKACETNPDLPAKDLVLTGIG